MTRRFVTPGLPGAARMRRFLLVSRTPGSAKQIHSAQNRSRQTSPYESESKLSHSTFPIAVILGFESESSLTENVFRRDKLRNLDVDLRPLPFFAANIHFELVAIQQAQALMHVTDANAAAIHLNKSLG